MTIYYRLSKEDEERQKAWKKKRAAQIMRWSIALAETGMKLWKKKKILKRLRRGTVKRDREAVLEEMNELPNYVFKSMFRLDRSFFFAYGVCAVCI